MSSGARQIRDIGYGVWMFRRGKGIVDGSLSAAAIAALAAALVAIGACGSSGVGGQQPPAASATAAPTAPPCPAAAAAATAPPIGKTQALTVIRILVTPGAPTTPGVERFGSVSCLSVGVGQEVSIAIDARMPPVPSEPFGVHLLSAMAVTPSVASGAGVPGHYTVAFTAQAGGTTTLAYLPATCTLPPGAC
jgi:hypothetical protein